MRSTIVRNGKVVTNVRRFSFSFFVVAALATAVGCSKKETPAPTPDASTTPPAQATAPTHQPSPAPAPPPTAPAAPAQEIDTVVNDRSIAYLRALVARKDYNRARQQLKIFDGRTLSPAQQQELAQLKAQIPPG